MDKVKVEELDVKPLLRASGSGTGTSTPVSAAKTEDKKPQLAGLDFDLEEIEKLLAQDESLVNREQEVLRILRCFRLNPYEILDLDFTPGNTSLDDIRKSYRKRSLLIHPDKLKHPRGMEAFDLLKKASTELETPERRSYIDQTIADARMLIMRSLKLNDNAPDHHPRLQTLEIPLKQQILAKTKDILIDDELRKRRANRVQMIAEGAAAAEKEKELAEKKRKHEDHKAWEDSREARVTDWRSFQHNAGKKKKRSGYLG